MSRDKFEEYQKKYPNLFKEHPRSGFYLPEGWEQLVDSLCSVLEHHISYLSEEERGKMYCAQVKEKFGGLRFYMNMENQYISGAIAAAEIMSFHVCDVCGLPGSRRMGGWVRTLCDLHHKKNQKRLKEQRK